MNLGKKTMAVITAASLCALIVSGTLAWTSMNSHKVNEWHGTGSDSTTGPGGTLHDDHVDNGADKDVYVENWGTEDLFVRIKLGEYMEVGAGSGLKSTTNGPNPANLSTPVIGMPGNDYIDNPDKWTVAWVGDRMPENGDPPTGIPPWYRLSSYWIWEMGGQKYYYPAPEDTHTNKDYVDQNSPGNLTAGAVNDNGVQVKQTLSATVISMNAWKAMGSPIGNYWVIDRADGWAYWAAPLKPGDATGLLLSVVYMSDQAANYSQYFDLSKSYYYGVNVHAEMATKDGNDLENYKSFGEKNLGGGWTDDGRALIEKLVQASDIPDAGDANGDWNAKYVTLRNTSEAELMARVGDVDCLNTPDAVVNGYNPFIPGSTFLHSNYPSVLDPSDPEGTDLIYVGSHWTGAGQDGYSGSYSGGAGKALTVTMDYDLSGIAVNDAILQICADDFQASSYGSNFSVTLNGKDAPFIAELLNQINQGGPTASIVSAVVPSDFYAEIASGKLVITIDETTGVGDGYALDFVKLLVNQH